MIQLQVKGGAMFAPEDAEISITVGEGDAAKTYGWGDIAKLIMFDPELGIADGNMGGMPIRGLVLTDSSDLRVEVPMPLEAARAVGEQLQAGTRIEVARAVPTGLVAAERKPMWTPPPR